MKILIGTLALAAVALTGTQVRHADCFRYYFSSMGKADASINPVQRALFSLVLAQSNHPEKKMGPSGHPTPPHKKA